MPFVAFTVAKFNSNISLLLFVSAFIAAASFTYISERFRFFIHKKNETKRLHKTITPYLMNPKSVIKFWDSKKLFIVSGTSVFFIVCSSLFLYFGFNKTMQAYKNILYFPAPCRLSEISGFSKDAFDNFKKIKSGEDLPDLENLISDSWNLHIKPYIRLNDNKETVEKINYAEFSVDENGVVTEHLGEVFNLEKTLSFRQSPSIEDLLYSQGRFAAAAYIGKKFPLNSFNAAALFVALLSSLMPITIIILRVLNK